MEQPLSPYTEKLLAALKGLNPYTRKSAAEQLGNLKNSDPRIMQALADMAHSDSDPEARQAAIRALQLLEPGKTLT